MSVLGRTVISVVGGMVIAMSFLCRAEAAGIDVPNYIARGILGKWVPDVTLVNRFDVPKSVKSIELRENAAVVKKLPAEFYQMFPDNKIYLSGIFSSIKQSRKEDGGFVLISINGNPSLVMFRFKGSNMESAGIYVVSFGIGMRPENDLLLIGKLKKKGVRKNFTAYRRARY